MFLVISLSRGKASIVAPVGNALPPVLTVVLSLVAHQTLPAARGALGIALAIAGSTLIVFRDEALGDAGATPEARRETVAHQR